MPDCTKRNESSMILLERQVQQSNSAVGIASWLQINFQVNDLVAVQQMMASIHEQLRSLREECDVSRGSRTCSASSQRLPQEAKADGVTLQGNVEWISNILREVMTHLELQNPEEIPAHLLILVESVAELRKEVEMRANACEVIKWLMETSAAQNLEELVAKIKGAAQEVTGLQTRLQVRAASYLFIRSSLHHAAAGVGIESGEKRERRMGKCDLVD